MKPESWKQVKQALEEALSLPVPRREAFLNRLRSKDAAIHGEVVSLLNVQVEDRFLDRFFVGLETGPDPAPKNSRIGPYRILDKLGDGGMGSVYLAARDDGVYRQRVAVKILKKDMDTAQFAARFERERQILASLNHPNIAKLLDGGATADGLPYLIMEYIEGEPLRAYCDRRELSAAQRLDLFKKICHAVHYAHQNLVVHRDLKPANILVDAEGEPKLLDFGIAKMLAQDAVGPQTVTAASFSMMTPEYASPEQIQCEPITTASDVYSLGVALYELLAGRRPYRLDTRSFEEIRKAICEKEPIRLRDGASVDADYGRLLREAPADMESVVAMALRKEPNRRYASALQLAEDIDRCQMGFPVVARRGTWRYLAGKFLRRHLAAALFAAAFLAVILWFSMTLALKQRQTERQRDKAESLSQVLLDIFRGNDPQRPNPNQKDLSARELLDSAYLILEGQSLDMAPDVRADLLEAMGRAYLHIEQFNPAETMLSQSLALREGLGPDAAAKRIETLIALTKLASAKGEPARAQGFLDRAEAVRKKFLGDDDLLHARMLVSQGLVHHDLDQLREALEYYERGYAILSRLSGVEPAEELSLIGQIYFQLGEYEAAERAYRTALDMAESALGDHPLTANLYDDLGLLCRRKQRYALAKEHFEQALSIRGRLYDRESLAIAASYDNLGLAHLDLEDDDAAGGYLQQAAAIKERLLHRDHPKLSASYNRLGMLRFRQGRFEEALAQHLRALDIRRGLPGENNMRVGYSLNNLANVYAEMGRQEECEAFNLEAMAIFKSYGETHPNVYHSRHNLTALYRETARYDLADALCAQTRNDVANGVAYYLAIDLLCSVCAPMYREMGWDREAALIDLALSGAND